MPLQYSRSSFGRSEELFVHNPIMHTRSTDSQLDVSTDSKRSLSSSSSASSSVVPSPFRRTHPNNQNTPCTSPSSSLVHKKSTSPSLFRPSPSPDVDMSDLWTIKRCDAFDEGDSDCDDYGDHEECQITVTLPKW